MKTLALLSLLLGCVITEPWLGHATSAEDLAAMKTALRQTTFFDRFVKLWNRANAASAFEQAPFFNFFNVTVLAPIDPAFKEVSRINYRNPRCYNKDFAPDGCAFPIVTFHIFPQRITLSDFKAAPNGTVWNSLSGFGIQKVEGRGGRWGFLISPELEGDFGAKKFSPANLLFPNIYQCGAGNITVHAIDAVLPPPILYPDGWL